MIHPSGPRPPTDAFIAAFSWQPLFGAVMIGAGGSMGLVQENAGRP